jgi:hypothetical protein
VSSIPLAEGTTKGEDPDEGKLFEVPRVKVVIDESDPNVLKVALRGSVELDRTNAKQVEFFNSLKAGTACDLVVGVHVAGGRKVHRRDSEGDVDAIVETKSIVVTDVYLERPGDGAA